VIINKLILTILVVLQLFIIPTPLHAQEDTAETLEATVFNILEEKEITSDFSEEQQLYQQLELLVTKGSLQDKKIIIENGNIPIANLQKYQLGDKVMVYYEKDFDNNDYFYITDYIRRAPLLWLFIIFIGLVAIIAKWRGITSLLGMVASFFVIFKFILPKILSGSDPVLIAIIGSMFIIPITFYLSHGFNKKTTVAIAGTVIALIITGILATIFVNTAKLTGFASEEAGFLQVDKQGVVNIKGLLLAGIIIGVLGVLDDITISQSAIVSQLKKANPKLKAEELYKRAMDVGQDHISSMVNTLILVYTGAALPLLLLFINNPQPFSQLINYEIVADEIIRTLVGSIGLILAVPITTIIAVSTIKNKKT
jgi:uncharacterized membrane protein